MADSEDETGRGLLMTVIDGRYRVERRIAGGAMGEVYLGLHLKLKKRVAIKVLRPDAKNHPDLAQRFEREALAGAQINHAHVASATDFGDLEDGSQYLVMEYVRGTTLRAAIDAARPFSTTRAVRVARQIAMALSEIHDRGIVHRDLKPRNVMLSSEDFVKIVDFGLAKLSDARPSTFTPDPSEVMDEDRLTGQGVIMGTVEYLAPEAAFGMELVDHRADLYALGVILYEMLAGKHPFEGRTEGEIFAKHRHATPKPIGERSPGVAVPSAVEAIVMRLLEKDFDARFQSAALLIAALDDALPEGRNTPAPPEDAALSSSAIAVAPPSEPKPTSLEEADDDPPAETEIPVARPDPTPAASAPPRSSVVLWGGALALSLSALIASQSRDVSRDPPGPSRPPRVASSVESRRAPPPPASASSLEAPPVPSAIPTVSASAVSPPIDVEALADAISKKSWDDVARRTLEIARTGRGLEEMHVARIVLSALTGLSKESHARADEVWRAVALAPSGPDALYRFTETKGASNEAQRARALLRDAEVQRGASPALLIAFRLRDAACDEKLKLLDEAVREGDARSINAIDIAVRGCLKNPRPADEALRKLRQRLSKSR